MEGARYHLLTLFADGGPWMYPLVLCSLLALGVGIAKAYTLWVAHRDTKQVLGRVSELARDGRIEDAIQEAADTRGPCAAILHAGLMRIRDRTVRAGELEQAITTTGTIELGFLERGLVVLATIANVAPLMGFLGTVAGMILAFASIETAGQVDPALVAGGIKVALLTTAAGLVIAIPVNIFYNYFVSKIDRLIVNMEQGAQEILNLAWDMERDGSLEVITEKSSGTAAAAAAAAAGAAAIQPEAAAAVATAPVTESDLGGLTRRVEEIQGIGKSFGHKLRDMGVSTTHELLLQCRNATGRASIQERLDVDAARVDNWTTQADLLRIDGMSGDAAEIIAAAGIATLPRFCQTDAAGLAGELPAINEERRLVVNEALPNVAAIEAWQELGRRLDPIIEDL